MVELTERYACRGAAHGCSFAIAKQIAGKQISRAMAKRLIKKGSTQLLKGFVGRSGREFSARLKLDADGKLRFELDAAGSD